MSESGKKLSELRVCDLKAELERRGLEVLGAKATLMERLEKALKSKGLDPAKFVFGSGEKKAMVKKSPVVVATPKMDIKIKEEPLDEEPQNQNQNGNNAKRKSQEEVHNEDDSIAAEDEIDQVGTVDDECVIIEDSVEELNIDGNGNDDEANEADDDGNDDEDEENSGESNNHDNEEGINLTIGEEEQKLLHDEAPDDKEKPTDTISNQKDKGAGQTAKEMLPKGERTTNSAKEEKKSAKDDETNKTKKKEDKTGDKKEDSEQKSTTTKSTQKEDKEKAANSATSANNNNTNSNSSAKTTTGSGKTATPSRNLWVSGLSSLTRASDLKTIFSKYGKVFGAKVVTNTRTPGTRCYGYVTMSSSADASRCIDHLHRTELHGRIILVERTKNEIGGSSASANKDAAKNSSARGERKDDDKKSSGKDGSDKRKGSDGGKRDDSKKDADKDKDKDKAKGKSGDKKADSKENKDRANSKSTSRRGSQSMDRSRSDRSRERRQREREQRQREREQRQREILSYEKIREERERQRLRERERQLREEERRRREIRDRQRQEEQRLAEERKKLAMERERLEREKAELLRLERERQKLEREKIELERLELTRQQLKIMQSREDPIKRVSKRAPDERYVDVSDRKRTSGADNRFEAPPPPRFDASLVTRSAASAAHTYDKKRDDYGNSTGAKRGIEEYTPSSKRMDYAKRDEYVAGGAKRPAIDDYSSVPSKRSTDDYTKRSSDYISSSSKRNLDEYTPSNKRDDYSTKATRDEYKREIEIRHIPVASGGTNSSFHTSSTIHKAGAGGSRYGDGERNSSSNYRRNGIDDLRNSATLNKRYDSTSGYGNTSGSSSNNIWATSSTHLGGGSMPMKNYGNNMSSNMHTGSSNWQKSVQVEDSGWRQIQGTQDHRFDRTYNERSTNNYASGGYTGGRPAQDRYGPSLSSRY